MKTLPELAGDRIALIATVLVTFRGSWHWHKARKEAQCLIVLLLSLAR